MPDDLCELSDLPVSMCACRVHRPAEVVVSAGRHHGRWHVAGQIPARHAAPCAGCGEPIEVGDPIYMLTDTPGCCGGWRCATCRAEA